MLRTPLGAGWLYSPWSSGTPMPTVATFSQTQLAQEREKVFFVLFLCLVFSALEGEGEGLLRFLVFFSLSFFTLSFLSSLITAHLVGIGFHSPLRVWRWCLESPDPPLKAPRASGRPFLVCTFTQEPRDRSCLPEPRAGAGGGFPVRDLVPAQMTSWWLSFKPAPQQPASPRYHFSELA